TDLTSFIERDLGRDPRGTGWLIPQTGGLWKARMPIPSMHINARGGLRVIYVILEEAKRVGLARVYYKKELADLVRRELTRARVDVRDYMRAEAVKRGVNPELLERWFR